MAIRGFLKRIERAEQALKAQGHFSPDCICFPGHEAISFSWPLEQQIAFALKCPLHGDRFRPMGHIYVSKWIREKQEYFLGKRKSAQYRKAWSASFAPELWPGEEVNTGDGKIFLKLKDGTRLLVYEPIGKPLSKTAAPAPFSGGNSIEQKVQG